MQVQFIEPGIWDVHIPRRHGKTTFLKQQAQRLASNPKEWPIYCYAPSQRSREALGVPILEGVPDRCIILLLDDYDLCANAMDIQQSVLAAGGIVIRTWS